jgi:tetratricopeptide (TPR) repeat protein
VFVVDDLVAWLIGTLADEGLTQLTNLTFGDPLERALSAAIRRAVGTTTTELCPDDSERADDLADLINKRFKKRKPDLPLGGHDTVLEALHASVAIQLMSLSGDHGEILGVSVAILADTLPEQLIKDIMLTGIRGGPLEPLASRLNQDRIYLQGQRAEAMLARLEQALAEALARWDSNPGGGSAPGAVALTLAELPAAPGGFAGRVDDLAWVLGQLDPSRAASAICLAGLPGVGKSTLAVQAGHAAQGRGWFAGGVLFINLLGYDEQRLGPDQAIDALLRALGVPRDHIPSDPRERERLYRSTLTQFGDPVLIIADNASSEAQVRPLLPAAGPHKVLITSRDTLAALNASLREVPVLDDRAAVDLLEEALRIARPEDDRVATARESAVRLARVCGGLPLALQMVAAILKAEWPLRLAELADELATDAGRLDRLTYDDGSEPGTNSVTAAFDLSYRRLDDLQAGVFRLMSIAPGPDISAVEAAALADLPVPAARRVLAGLAKAHLAEATAASVAPAPRWRMHDLVRAYARRLSDEHATADGREAGLDRLFGYYLVTATQADRYLRGQQGTMMYAWSLPTTVEPEFSDRDGALTWLDAERASLVAAVSVALASGRDPVVLNLPGVLTTYLYWHRHFDDFLNTMSAAYEVAQRLGEVDYEAMALTSLSPVLREVGRSEDAIDAARSAVTLYTWTRDAANRARALNNLGMALRDRQEFEEAITAYQDAIGIFRQAGDRLSEATAQSNLSMSLTGAGQFEDAVADCYEALEVFRQTGHQDQEAAALLNLAEPLRRLGRFDEAADVSRRAADLFAEAGDQHNHGVALGNLSVALRGTGRLAEAVTTAEQAVAIFTASGDQAALTKATSTLAAARAAST